MNRIDPPPPLNDTSTIVWLHGTPPSRERADTNAKYKPTVRPKEDKPIRIFGEPDWTDWMPGIVVAIFGAAAMAKFVWIPLIEKFL